MRAIFDGLMMQWLSEKDPEATFGAYRERCERELLSYLLAGPLATAPLPPGDKKGRNR
jgi:hypothetical protein